MEGKMRVIGLTGGVGSGKSLVAQKICEMYGAELLIADELGHVVMKSGTDGFSKIVEIFGEDIVAADGEIDRDKLSAIVFKDDALRRDLNNIIHPEVKKYIENFIDSRNDKEATIILETAIMYESGCDKYCDEVWYVYVPAKIRIERLQESRGYTYEKSESIIKKQKSDKFFMERADKSIRNESTIADLGNEISSVWSI